VLTDLLSTYLTHKAGEREKYYQAELKRKPTLKAFGDQLLEISPEGEIVGVAATKEPELQLKKVYDPKQDAMVHVPEDEAVNMLAERPKDSYSNQARDFFESYKASNPNIDVSNLESTITDINTKEEYTAFRGRLSKEETRHASGKRRGMTAEASQLVKQNNEIYSKLGNKFTAFTGEEVELDKKARIREKRAIQKMFNANRYNKKVYVKEDIDGLRSDLKKYLRSKKFEFEDSKIDNADFQTLNDFIANLDGALSEKGLDMPPFYIHMNRYKGFNEYQQLMDSFGQGNAGE
jgi:phage protein U